MINFFRKTRKKLLPENKLSKYLVYAIGEIVLVVIGILIALQINTWKIEAENRVKERTYLIDIKENLLNDKTTLKEEIVLCEIKTASIDTVMRLLSQPNRSDEYLKKLIDYNGIMMSYPYFESINVAFDNLLSSDKIDIIQNKDLRLLLSQYYTKDNQFTSEASKENTRIYARTVYPKIIGNKYYQKPRGFDIDFEDDNFLEFHNDRKAISSFYILRGNTWFQGVVFNEGLKELNELIVMIENELNEK